MKDTLQHKAAAAVALANAAHPPKQERVIVEGIEDRAGDLVLRASALFGKSVDARHVAATVLAMADGDEAKAIRMIENKQNRTRFVEGFSLKRFAALGMSDRERGTMETR